MCETMFRGKLLEEVSCLAFHPAFHVANQCLWELWDAGNIRLTIQGNVYVYIVSNYIFLSAWLMSSYKIIISLNTIQISKRVTDNTAIELVGRRSSNNHFRNGLSADGGSLCKIRIVWTEYKKEKFIPYPKNHFCCKCIKSVVYLSKMWTFERFTSQTKT